jgi:hypothetical protein
MDKKTHDRRLVIRKAVLGEAYAGIPAGVDSFRIAREVFAELDKG